MEYTDYIHKFESSIARYIPKPGDWTPSDHAVYGPSDYFRTEQREADDLRFKAVKYQFTRHFAGK
jgi:hypothetical protein